VYGTQLQSGGFTPLDALCGKWPLTANFSLELKVTDNRSRKFLLVVCLRGKRSLPAKFQIMNLWKPRRYLVWHSTWI